MNQNTQINNPAESKQKENVFPKGHNCFPGQREDEVVEAIFMRHWIVLFPLFIMSLVLFALLIGANAAVRYLISDNIELFQHVSTILNFTFISILLHFFFISILNYYLNVIILTNIRLIDVKFSTVFKRNMDALDLHNIQDINIIRKGLLRWLFNFGRIVMHNSAGTELFHFRYLKNPLKNYNMINHVHFQAIHARQQESQEVNKNQNNPQQPNQSPQHPPPSDQH